MIVKIDPVLHSLQKLAKGLLRSSFGDGKIEKTNESFRVAIVGPHCFNH